MNKLDPRLQYMLRRKFANLESMAATLRLGSRKEGLPVLVRCRREARAAIEERLGRHMRILTMGEGPEVVVSGIARPEALAALAADEWVRSVGGAHRLHPELDISCGEVKALAVHQGAAGLRGAGVAIGFIDTGIDFRHPDFLDAQGRSRILFLWDQEAPAGGGTPGPGNVGRVYTKQELDAALAGGAAILHQDTKGHGTNIAGVAAGSGRAPGAAGRMVGVAPEASLIVVATPIGPVQVFDSQRMVAALEFIAACAPKGPLVVNISNGTNCGGHAGESEMEDTIDGLARRPGVVFVKSAGNEQDKRTHASGRVVEGTTERRRWLSGAGNVEQDVMEIWFDAADRISIAVQPPGAAAPAPADFAAPGSVVQRTTSIGNTVEIDATRLDAQDTGDVQVLLLVGRGSRPEIEPGVWTVHLRGDRIADGGFHAWIERAPLSAGGPEQAQFLPVDADPSCSITVPGTARRVVTVGAYVTRRPEEGGAQVGQLSRFSASGPTRYGLPKPELAAPGQVISTAHPLAAGPYKPVSGTSVAAPHVAGAAALLLQKRPGLTGDQVRQLLERAARSMGAGNGPWGAGRLDVETAVQLAATAVFPAIGQPTVAGTVLQWNTDIPCKGVLRFNTHQRRMRLGRPLGELASASGQQHAVDLAGLPAGRYFCEILAESDVPERWSTLDDRGGQHYVVDVP